MCFNEVKVHKIHKVHKVLTLMFQINEVSYFFLKSNNQDGGINKEVLIIISPISPIISPNDSRNGRENKQINKFPLLIFIWHLKGKKISNLRHVKK